MTLFIHELAAYYVVERSNIGIEGESSQVDRDLETVSRSLAAPAPVDYQFCSFGVVIAPFRSTERPPAAPAPTTRPPVLPKLTSSHQSPGALWSPRGIATSGAACSFQ